MQPDNVLATLGVLACQAGALIMPYFRSDCAQTLKADRSPVTEADIASHEYLLAALGKLAPK